MKLTVAQNSTTIGVCFLASAAMSRASPLTNSSLTLLKDDMNRLLLAVDDVWLKRK